MNFSEKLRETRLSQDISQSELSMKTGISERSLYSYEQGISLPRSGNIKKLADALCVSVSFLLNDDEPPTENSSIQDYFILQAKNKFGKKGLNEAQLLLKQATVLFAGGELDESEKDIFFQSLMEVYIESKTEAHHKFSPKKRASKKK